MDPSLIEEIKAGTFPRARDWNLIKEILVQLKLNGYVDNPLVHDVMPPMFFVPVQCWASGYDVAGTPTAFSSSPHTWADHVGDGAGAPDIVYRVKFLGYVRAEVGNVDQGMLYRGYDVGGVINDSPLVLGEGSTAMIPLRRSQATLNEGKWKCPPEGAVSSTGWTGSAYLNIDGDWVLYDAGEMPNTDAC